jgi:hypothetical protein
MFSPLSEVELISQNSIITSRLRQLVRAALHNDDLIAYILKQTGWTHNTFHKVYWEVHKQAFMKHNRVHRISIAKLIHGLYQTRSRDHKYYGALAACPCCKLQPETLTHLFTCPLPESSQHWQEALLIMRKSLVSLQNPQPSWQPWSTASPHGLHLRLNLTT